MKIVFDTNFYVAVLKKNSLCFDLLKSVLTSKDGFIVCISEEIKDEVDEKLRLWLDNQWAELGVVQRLRWIIDNFAQIVQSTEKVNAVKNDPDDNKILECAVAAEADLIVTMDKHLLKLKSFRRIAIVHPKSFSYMFPRT